MVIKISGTLLKPSIRLLRVCLYVCYIVCSWYSWTTRCRGLIHRHRNKQTWVRHTVYFLQPWLSYFPTLSRALHSIHVWRRGGGVLHKIGRTKTKRPSCHSDKLVFPGREGIKSCEAVIKPKRWQALAVTDADSIIITRSRALLLLRGAVDAISWLREHGTDRHWPGGPRKWRKINLQFPMLIGDGYIYLCQPRFSTFYAKQHKFRAQCNFH